MQYNLTIECFLTKAFFLMSISDKILVIAKGSKKREIPLFSGWNI